MCGIAGHIGKKEPSSEGIERALELMHNRGPDARGVRKFNASDEIVTFLHSRLSIIDLDSRSNQPFTIGPCSIVFNGEIYNYLELKEKLEKRGHEFHTTSDTEVLLASYLEYGADCVRDFEGMWSFAIFDERSKDVLLSRDRFGEKPLYYTQNSSGFYFASEVKALASLAGVSFSVNRQHLMRYLVHGYRSMYKTGDTFFEDVKELAPGCSITIRSAGNLDCARYWQPTFQESEISEEEAIEGVRERLVESVRLRLRSDVPLAFCLSGGVDSGALASIAAKCFQSDVHSFSIIDTDERYNEQPNIQKTVDDIGCKNTSIVLEPSKSFDRLRNLIEYHDAPIATITYYIHSFLSEQISNQGFKVVFSGTAADELFTGYYDHFPLHLYEMKGHPEYASRLSEWKEHIQKFVRNPHLSDPDLYLKDPDFRDHIYLNRDEFCSFLKNGFEEGFTEEIYTDKSLLRNRMLNEIFHEITPVILHEDDLNSMLYSIENRSPYLDSKLFDFMFSVPNAHLIKHGYGKYLLRESVKGILNDDVRLDRQKKGFNAAIDSVFDFNSQAIKDLLFEDSPLYDFVHREKVESLLKKDTMPNSFSKFLFNIINCKLFLEICG